MFAPTVIPSHMRINGRITTSGDLIIEGRCTGELEVGGTLTIAAGAHCQAFVRAHEARILGRVEGTIVCRRTISVGPGAQIIGSMEAPAMDVHPAAQVQGTGNLTAAAPVPAAPPRKRVRLVVKGPGMRRPAPPAVSERPTRPVTAHAAAAQGQRAIPTPPRIQGRVRVSRTPHRGSPGRSGERQ